MTGSISRRGFLSSGAGACLVVSIGYRPQAIEPEAITTFAPGPYLSIDTNGNVSVSGFRSEMGQGIHTAIAMIVAEELEADWRRVRVANVTPDTRLQMQTSGSRSVRTQYLPLRKAGAAARMMLCVAAAARWNVAMEQVEVSEGVVLERGGRRRLPFGALVAAAARVPVPSDPPLKTGAFRIIGTSRPRLDTPAKSDGSARFGLDIRVPGLRYACMVRPPVLEARLTAFDAVATKALPGVVDVVRLGDAVAVVATNSWAAMRGAALVTPTWSTSPHDALNSETIDRDLRARSLHSPVVARNDGDALSVIQGATAAGLRCLEAEYTVPYLAHATMEPQNCTAWVRADSVELWVPTQGPQRAQQEAVELTGVPAERVTVHTTYLGGGFGRRGKTDFVREAVLVSRAVGGPVQVLWTREDDMRHDFYRPATYNRMAAAVNAAGAPVAYHHCATGQSIRQQQGALSPDAIDSSSVEGSIDLPYAVPHLRVDYCRLEGPVPIGAWRSVGHSQNVFVVESFWDEVAALAVVDPFEFRRRHLSDARLKGVLELAASKAGWEHPLAPGRFRGIACTASFGSFAAEVAEISVDAGTVRVHRVVAAIDCGQVINPDTVVAQMESGIVYGLSAALYGEITLKNGRVEQGNFNDYPILRLPGMPVIEVHIVPSTEAPGGVGEPGTPPIAPAVANAVFAATGKRIRSLPIRV